MFILNTEQALEEIFKRLDKIDKDLKENKSDHGATNRVFNLITKRFEAIEADLKDVHARYKEASQE